MKTKGLKYFILLAISVLSFQAVAGSEGRGGGDMCEDRIKIIRDDIKDWILKGGAKNLQLNKNLSQEEYSKKMLYQIEKTKIKCVGENDNGHPVEINGTPKTCRFDKKSDRSEITCDYEKFQNTSQEKQYILVHHEYAGLADIERPDGDSSNYEISNQISGYLEDHIVKKLVVKSANKEPIMGDNGYRLTLKAYDVYMLLNQQKNDFMRDKAKNIEFLKDYSTLRNGTEVIRGVDYINPCDYDVSYNENDKTVTISLRSAKYASGKVTLSEMEQSGSYSTGRSAETMSIKSLTYATLINVTGTTIGSRGTYVTLRVDTNFNLKGIGWSLMEFVSNYNVQTGQEYNYWSLIEDNKNTSCSRNDYE